MRTCPSAASRMPASTLAWERIVVFDRTERRNKRRRHLDSQSKTCRKFTQRPENEEGSDTGGRMEVQKRSITVDGRVTWSGCELPAYVCLREFPATPPNSVIIASAMIYAKAGRAKILCTYTVRVCSNVPVWLAAGVGRNFRGLVTITALRMLSRYRDISMAPLASHSLRSSRSCRH